MSPVQLFIIHIQFCIFEPNHHTVSVELDISGHLLLNTPNQSFSLKTNKNYISSSILQLLILKYLRFLTNLHIHASFHCLRSPVLQDSNPIREIAFQLMNEEAVFSRIQIFARQLLFLFG